MQETWVQSLGGEAPLEEEMATHPSILAWRTHGQRSLVGYSPWGLKSQTRLSDWTTTTSKQQIERTVSTQQGKNKLFGRIMGSWGHAFNLQRFLKWRNGGGEMPVDCFSFKRLGTWPVLAHLMLLQRGTISFISLQRSWHLDRFWFRQMDVLLCEGQGQWFLRSPLLRTSKDSSRGQTSRPWADFWSHALRWQWVTRSADGCLMSHGPVPL